MALTQREKVYTAPGPVLVSIHLPQHNIIIPNFTTEEDRASLGFLGQEQKAREGERNGSHQKRKKKSSTWQFLTKHDKKKELSLGWRRTSRSSATLFFFILSLAAIILNYRGNLFAESQRKEEKKSKINLRDFQERSEWGREEARGGDEEECLCWNQHLQKVPAP